MHKSTEPLCRALGEHVGADKQLQANTQADLLQSSQSCTTLYPHLLRQGALWRHEGLDVITSFTTSNTQRT